MSAADYSWGDAVRDTLTDQLRADAREHGTRAALAKLQAQADELARQDRDAILMWLRHSGAADRTELAARLLIGSVFAQAGLLGVVSCTRCGDRGCEWCASW